MKKINKNRKGSGFTLIELLVVIAIIAVLAIVVVLTLNPGQLIMQARDSNRVSDLSTTKSALSYYLQDQTPTAFGSAVSLTCYEDGPTLTGVAATTTCPWFATAPGTGTGWSSTSSRATNLTTSWIPINLSLISVGSPIGQWPIDPLNTLTAVSGTGGFFNSGNYFYSFAVSSTVSGGFKLNAKMESTKYSRGGSGDVESTDGGTYSSTYEAGMNLSL